MFETEHGEANLCFALQMEEHMETALSCILKQKL